MLMYEEKTEYVRVTSKFKASGRIYLMKLVEMSIVNYRQFKKADISFDDGITVLAGANNSGKTSLITLIKNVFNDEKTYIVNRIFQQRTCRIGLIEFIQYLKDFS